MQRLFFILICFLSAGISVSAQQFSATDFKALHALKGLWKMETNRGTIYEAWEIIDNNKLSGRSFRVSNTDTVLLEKVQLYLDEKGIFYCPLVSNQNNNEVVSFKLISNTNGRYTFENKEHDFPQRVIYEPVSKDVLNARIEGIRKGQERGSDFKYSRVK